MTHEEAIQRLKKEINEYTPYAEKWDEARLDIEAFNMAIQALEKQTPKMVNYIADGYSGGTLVYDMAECPNCGAHFEECDQFWESKFCLDCGQALEWEEKEE